MRRFVGRQQDFSGGFMARPLFELGPRLAACARLIRPGRPVADVGTDHAYLPIWLLRSSLVPRAVGVDVNAGPLRAARSNAKKYGVEEKLRLLLSDGLRGLAPEDADDIVIAGMGGELILRMIGETPWLCSPEKQLVLQPMSSVPELRLGLVELGFEVLREEAAIDAEKAYSAFSVGYIGAKPETDPLYPFLGKLAPGADGVKLYAEKVLRELSNQRRGASHRKEIEREQRLASWMEQIRSRYL